MKRPGRTAGPLLFFSLGNAFYKPGDERAARVGDLFGAIAPRYDFINDLQSLGLHRLWKNRLVRLAAVGPGARVLDLCCGTGDVTFRLARTGADATGMDFSEAMLEVARERARRLGKRGRPTSHGSPSRAPVFVAGDALKAPFPDNSFDAVTIAYGLRNLSSWEAGLEEMWRLARPRGRVLVLDFGKPDHPAWRWLYFAYLRWLVPLFGRVFCGDAALYSYILESLVYYPAQHGVAAKMRAMGCADARIVPLLGGMMTINFGLKA